MEEFQQSEFGAKLSKCMFIPQRLVLGLMGFLAIVNAYTMRGCLSMALTQMVVKIKKEANSTDICERLEPELPNPAPHKERYEWDQVLQGYVIGMFYGGYIITHIPGGWLADYFGGKYVLSLGILSTAVLTIVTPPIVEAGGVVALLVLRFFVGVGEGTTFPALATLLSQWVPKKERGRIGALVLGGGLFGNVINTFLTGYLLKHFAWPVTFYVMGILAIVWFLFFTVMCFSDPISHPYIKLSEVQYLYDEMGHIKRKKHLNAPWGDILTSCPVYSLILCQVGHDWGIFAMSNNLPKYLNDIIQFPIHKTGNLLAMTYMIQWLVTVIWGFVTDVVIKKEILTLTTTRKLNTLIAAVGPGCFLVFASWAECDRVLVIVMFCFSQGLMGPYFSGMKLTPLDMAPNFAGIIMALSNGLSAIMGLIGPIVLGHVTYDVTLTGWRTFYYISCFMLCSTAIQFMWWGTGDIQPWNEPKEKEAAA